MGRIVGGLKPRVIGGLAAMAIVAAAAGPALACEKQVQRGYVVATSGPQGVYSECAAFVDALVHTATRGGLSYQFPVDRSTHGKRFRLTSDLPADLDIVFIRHSLTQRVEFGSFGLDGEEGIVPRGARRAYVCLAAGPPTEFTYEAGG